MEEPKNLRDQTKSLLLRHTKTTPFFTKICKPPNQAPNPYLCHFTTKNIKDPPHLFFPFTSLYHIKPKLKTYYNNKNQRNQHKLKSKGG